MKIKVPVDVRAHIRGTWKKDPMINQETLFGELQAQAEREIPSRATAELERRATLGMVRTSDPATSRAAAASVIPKMNETRQRVLDMLIQQGRATDERLVGIFFGIMAPSAVRTRRAELVVMGLVKDSGTCDTLKSGRLGIVWEPVK